MRTHTYRHTISVFGWVSPDRKRNQECVFSPESKANTDHWSRWWSPTLVHQSHTSEGYLGSECMIIWLWPHFTCVVPVSWNFFFLPPPELSWIPTRPSILLLVIPPHCLFISALSCMGKLDWFSFQWWRTGKLRAEEKCLGASAKWWHRQMAPLDG